ncbi:MAG: TIGR02266 family protein [Archangium sp.]|nr:TIGR02266 family protein [Archangium sp.]MDP3152410.1 TIGR02266 family protein [Archangium sp.]MDP3572420.1 TIGR02266 family protein [Archangium sp.]
MDVELSRAETELQSEEAALHAELSRLAQVSGELAGRLTILHGQAAEVGDAAVAQRARVAPPVIDPDAGFAKARAAREAAVKARRDTNTAVRAQLATAKAQLQKMASQLLADERAIAAAQAAPPPAPMKAAPPPPPPSPPSPRAVPSVTEAMKKPIRTSGRVKMQAAVDFNSDNNFFNGFSANISDGGLFVATVNLLPLGTEVDLSFTLPSGERIEAKGKVQWVREVNDQLIDAFPGMGVQFSSLNPAAQNAITQFLVQRDPLFFADAE